MRWKCTCAYDGSQFAGWQIQSGRLTVQQSLEEALEAVLKERVTIHGSGRTDAGVHALEQVFHFDFDWRHPSAALVSALATKLPRSIQVQSAVRVADEFHARFSAIAKRYHYRLYLGQPDPFQWPYCWSVGRNLDLNRMHDGLRALLGTRDFAAFAANRGLEYETTVRTLRAAELSQQGDSVLLTFEADGFLYKMVRSLTGCLVNVGLRRIEPTAFERLLQGGGRTALVQVAPAQGLFLEKVIY